MYAYHTPGVYFEWLDTQSPPIFPLRTDIAGFVGIAERGPLFQAVKVESWTQFTSSFGGCIPQSYLAYAIEGFFANGGQTCWVTRVADPDSAHEAGLVLEDDQGTNVLSLTASSRGVWGQGLTASVLHTGGDRFLLQVQLADGRQERWRNLTMAPALDTTQLPSIEKTLNDAQNGSRLVVAKWHKNSLPRAGIARFMGGQDGLAPTQDLTDCLGKPLLRLITAGRWSYDENIQVTVARIDEKYFSLTLYAPDLTQEFWPRLTLQRWLNKETREPDPAYVESVLNEPQSGSRLVIARDLQVSDTLPVKMLVALKTSLSGGLSVEHFKQGLTDLEDKDEVSVVAMPDMMSKPFRPARIQKAPVRCDVPDTVLPPSTAFSRPEFAPAFTEPAIMELQNTLVRQCERLKDRVAILDVPRLNGQDLPPPAVIAWRNRFATRYAALYYPWLRVPDPLSLDGLLCDVPPCGHIAGIYARVDRQVGVHKPPANEVLAYAQDVSIQVDDLLHGVLNDQAVNVIRAYRGRGLRLAGERTLSADPEWRYINVRRLLIMIEEAIDQQTQWIVFEPNNPDLWREVDRVVRSFLDGLWRRGMLDGATAADAYAVTCDETTNPPEETEMGRLICRIGVQPPWPAEFVVVRIGKTEGGTQVIETAELGVPGGIVSNVSPK